MINREIPEDSHFYIDYAPSEKVLWILQSLDPRVAITVGEIAHRLEQEHGVTGQKLRTEWPRRLHDLGLAHQERSGARTTYRLSRLGAKVREIEAVDPQLHPDLMHFLHFSSFEPTPQCRKYLWSYRRCSELAWGETRLLSAREIAARVQSDMRRDFPDLDYQARTGTRFDSTAAGRWLRWVRGLEPSPFPDDDNTLKPRVVSRCELALLALDDTYRARRYRYGDPVILDGQLLDEVSRVFFLDLACCRELIDLAARLTKAIRLSDTFAGTSVTLLAPYGIERI